MVLESFINPNVTMCNMAELIQNLKKRKYVEELCERYSLNINILKPIFELSMRGYNNSDMAPKIGVHRITIQRYFQTLKKLKESEFQSIYSYILGEQNERK